jgi:muramoyltetrapeptide carboxypeptidase
MRYVYFYPPSLWGGKDSLIKMIIPPFLNPGDKVAFVSPAKLIGRHETKYAIEKIKSWGLQVEVNEAVYGQWNRFAGKDKERLIEVQRAFDNPSIKAIFFSRGGYGSVRIIDKLNFKCLIENPKWLIGYSDITVFHQHLMRNFNMASIHGPMPLNITPDLNCERASDLLRKLLFGESLVYEIPVSNYNQLGTANGFLVGGNLSVLASLIGTDSQTKFDGKLLFIEDLCEELYHLDRMLYQFKKAGVFEKITGLVIGGFTEMTDVSNWFGKQNAYDIIHEHVKEYSFPACFSFPAGHIPLNSPLILGAESQLDVTKDMVYLKQKTPSE